MIPVAAGVRIWIATGHTDMRKGMNGLALLVQEGLGRDPFAGDVFVFRGRAGSLIKALWHDGIGLSLYSKRLDRGRFVWPATVDGAVVMNRRFELLGFGGEITVAEPVRQIHRAVDLEASESIPAMVDHEGTRHRSAYRLCQAVPGALAFVVSQDGGITVVHARDHRVLCWDQRTFGL